MKAIYAGNNFNDMSNPVEVFTGTGYVSLGVNNGKTRWGDYSAVTRVHNAAKPTIWCFGMYGNTSHSWTNRFAKITTTGWATDITDVKLEETNVKVFPNPIIEDIYKIEINLTENSPLEINIMDLFGKKIKSLYKTNGIKGENLFTFNKGALAAGTYILNITSNNKVLKNEKISVIR